MRESARTTRRPCLNLRNQPMAVGDSIAVVRPRTSCSRGVAVTSVCRGFAWVGVALTVAVSAQCARPAQQDGESATVVALLDCSALDIRHVLRVRAADHVVEDLTSSPAKLGVAETSATEWVLRFHEPRDNYDLVLQIDRVTGLGTRRLFDDEQQAINGHGGTDNLSCTPGAAR